MRYPLDHMKIRPLQFGAMEPLTNTFGMVRTNVSNQPKPHQGWDLEAPIGAVLCHNRGRNNVRGHILQYDI